jgi:hypothetical protein
VGKENAWAPSPDASVGPFTFLRITTDTLLRPAPRLCGRGAFRRSSGDVRCLWRCHIPGFGAAAPSARTLSTTSPSAAR